MSEKHGNDEEVFGALQALPPAKTPPACAWTMPAEKISVLSDGEDDAPAFLPNRVVKLKAGVLEPERDAARVRDAAHHRGIRAQRHDGLQGVGFGHRDVRSAPHERARVPARLDAPEHARARVERASAHDERP